MSDIDEIKKYLKPWTGRDGVTRYYVDNWRSLIGEHLEEYCAEKGFRASDHSDARVWYDTEGFAHADRIADPGLKRFIERTMGRTQFQTPESGSQYECKEYAWPELLRRLPHLLKEDETGQSEGADVFRFHGKDFYVEHGFLVQQSKDNRMAYYELSTGRIVFWSEASDLLDLVRELVKDAAQKDKEPEKQTDIPKGQVQLILPRSRWTKAIVLEQCRSARVSRTALATLEKMNLDDILDMYLRYESTEITGSEWDSEKRRHTKFYSLDVDNIEKLNRSPQFPYIPLASAIRPLAGSIRDRGELLDMVEEALALLFVGERSSPPGTESDS